MANMDYFFLKKKGRRLIINKNKLGFGITITEIDCDEMDTIELISIEEIIDRKSLKTELQDKFNQILIYIDKFLLD